ncbi:hypothetical protein [uncultured Methanobrevibacter sp.]|uniref:hypothetical protein n=1 Tax=uncultured Methanobrevibacter sp. TaxID=253161 RepID=UPI001DDC48E2|nr:hypothetical protein [uncultured Methanobrevibacter sp.]MBE6492737.1 hypothetical protein [Methanobrevibacter sp.]
MIQKYQKAERIFAPSNNIKNTYGNLEKFIIENFQIPDNDLKRICQFIREDNNLEKIIYDLPRLIQSEISYNRLQIKFYDEFQDDEVVLEITAFSSLNIENILKKEDEIIHRLYENYSEKSADKILIFIEG